MSRYLVTRLLLLSFLTLSVTERVEAVHAETSAARGRCSPSANSTLSAFVAKAIPAHVDDVQVCGVAAAPTKHLPARDGSGPHHLTSVWAPIGRGRRLLIAIFTNDDLDGIVVAKRGENVSALGQAFLMWPQEGPFVAGLHDTHCATHIGAADGWIRVNDRLWPMTPCSQGR